MQNKKDLEGLFLGKGEKGKGKGERGKGKGEKGKVSATLFINRGEAAP